jgi:thiamine pyrophosphokinase
MPRAVIFANGELTDPEKARLLLRADDVILCADGGRRHAQSLGLRPQAVIGDLDSLTKDEINQLADADVQIHLYPPNKNETDLELALRYALDSGFNDIVVIAALGKRLDQTLANLAVLTVERLSGCDVRLDDGVEEAYFCRDQVQIEGRSGDLVSLIPWGSVVGGIRTAGLKWPLNDESLYPEKTRGVSNEMIGERASVSVSFGLLLVVHRRTS